MRFRNSKLGIKLIYVHTGYETSINKQICRTRECLDNPFVCQKAKQRFVLNLPDWCSQSYNPRQTFFARHRRFLLWAGLGLLAVVLVIVTCVSTIRSRTRSFVPSSKSSRANPGLVHVVIDRLDSAMGSSPFRT